MRRLTSRRPPARPRPALSVLALALVLPLAFDDAPVAAQQGDMEELHQLIASLLHVSPDDLWVGELHPSAPFDANLTAGTRIIGSIVRNPRAGAALLAVSGADAAAIALLRQRFEAAGWMVRPSLPHGGMSGGFQSSTAAGPTMLCSDPHVVTLFTPPPAGADSTHVTVNWTRHEDGVPGPCDPDVSGSRAFQSPLPGLAPPEDVQVRQEGGGRGLSGHHSSAALMTDRPIEPILEHYAAELTRHGMRLDTRETAGFAAVQTFTWTDEPGGGLGRRDRAGPRANRRQSDGPRDGAHAATLSRAYRRHGHSPPVARLRPPTQQLVTLSVTARYKTRVSGELGRQCKPVCLTRLRA